jgi:16S rRNA G527 N7-methylase RsmG
LLPPDVHTVVDIGSGAGLPGLVRALLARSQGRVLALTLLEPRAKRVAFLQNTVEQLGLMASVQCLKTTLGGYCERVGRTFDLVTSRAVFPLAEVVEQQAVLAGRYQLVHASVADLERWQAPGGWQIAAQLTYQPGAAAERGYILLQRV